MAFNLDDLDLVDDDLDQDVIAIAPNDNEVVVIIMPIRKVKLLDVMTF